MWVRFASDKAGLQRGDVLLLLMVNKIDNHQDLVFRIRNLWRGIS